MSDEKEREYDDGEEQNEENNEENELNHQNVEDSVLTEETIIFNEGAEDDYLTYKLGFFCGLGVTGSQVKLICLEFLQMIVIYFYLDLFSYSIYQETLNKGEKSLQGQKFDFHTLNLNEYVIDYVQRMSEAEFQCP